MSSTHPKPFIFMNTIFLIAQRTRIADIYVHSIHLVSRGISGTTRVFESVSFGTHIHAHREIWISVLLDLRRMWWNMGNHCRSSSLKLRLLGYLWKSVGGAEKCGTIWPKWKRLARQSFHLRFLSYFDQSYSCLTVPLILPCDALVNGPLLIRHNILICNAQITNLWNMSPNRSDNLACWICSNWG